MVAQEPGQGERWARSAQLLHRSCVFAPIFIPVIGKGSPSHHLSYPL